MNRFSRVVAGIGVTILTATMAACSGASFVIANAPTYFGSYRRVADLPYGPGPRQKLDVYSPKGTGQHPVVVFFYGGSWTAGEKSQYRFVGAALAERGFVAVLPNYQLYPAAKFPEFMADGAGAVAWVQKHATEFGGDPEQIVLMGHSAGGHMAALLALDSRYLTRAGANPGAIIGLVGLSGPYALDPNTDTLRATFPAPYTLADWRPVQFVSDRSPPTLLLHGVRDSVVSVSHAEKLRDALLAHNVRVETQLYPDRGHTDTLASFAWVARGRTPALQQTINFLQSVSRQSDPSH